MKLQLNTGKTINAWYIPKTEDVLTGVNSGSTVTLGPFNFTLDSTNSAVAININLGVSASGNNIDPIVDYVQVKLIRNENSASPIFDQRFSFIEDSPNLPIYLNYVDNAPRDGLGEGENGNISYSLDLILTLNDVPTASYSITSIEFYEIDTPTELFLTSP